MSFIAGGLILGPLFFTWSGVIVFLVLSGFTLCVGHSVGFHRRLIHRSFECPKWLERVMIYVGVLVGMGGPIWTVGLHDIRDWAQRQTDCHWFLRHGKPALADGFYYLNFRLVFDHPPTNSELCNRSTLVYHELAHQWFGNLVTMRWFDDLWLKEGFATFVAYRAMADLEPQRRAWLRFLQHVKPRAYEVDGTPGTTPVYQQLANLADAKSAYGAIVYNKAPAVLRELDERLGADAFRAGLHAFLDEHRFGNATWQDLARALESTAKVDLRRWSDRWLLAPSKHPKT